jgi:hypothetical protein
MFLLANKLALRETLMESYAFDWTRPNAGLRHVHVRFKEEAPRKNSGHGARMTMATNGTQQKY